eukprot:Opistho-2@89911
MLVLTDNTTLHNNNNNNNYVLGQQSSRIIMAVNGGGWVPDPHHKTYPPVAYEPYHAGGSAPVNVGGHFDRRPYDGPLPRVGSSFTDQYSDPPIGRVQRDWPIQDIPRNAEFLGPTIARPYGAPVGHAEFSRPFDCDIYRRYSDTPDAMEAHMLPPLDHRRASGPDWVEVAPLRTVSRGAFGRTEFGMSMPPLRTAAPTYPEDPIPWDMVPAGYTDGNWRDDLFQAGHCAWPGCGAFVGAMDDLRVHLQRYHEITPVDDARRELDRQLVHVQGYEAALECERRRLFAMESVLYRALYQGAPASDWDDSSLDDADHMDTDGEEDATGDRQREQVRAEGRTPSQVCVRVSADDSSFGSSGGDGASGAPGSTPAKNSSRGGRRKSSTTSTGSTSDRRAGIIRGREIGPLVTTRDPRVKPPYSYATMIYHAIKSSPDGIMTLGNIYRWLNENFPFFDMNDVPWKNAIRHNLSLHACFKRVEHNKVRAWTVTEEDFRCRKGPRRRKSGESGEAGEMDDFKAEQAYDAFKKKLEAAAAAAASLALGPEHGSAPAATTTAAATATAADAIRTTDTGAGAESTANAVAPPPACVGDGSTQEPSASPKSAPLAASHAEVDASEGIAPSTPANPRDSAAVGNIQFVPYVQPPPQKDAAAARITAVSTKSPDITTSVTERYEAILKSFEARRKFVRDAERDADIQQSMA